MCPRTKEQNDRIRSDRLKQIAAAAADVFLEKGPALEIRDVALRAGIGYGTVYHYYPNKLKLLHDLLAEALPASAEATREALASGGSVPERLQRYAERLLTLWASNRSSFILFKLAAENYHQLPGDRSAEVDARFQTELFQPLARTIRSLGSLDAEEAERTADVLLGSLVGCAGLYLYRGQYAFDAAAIAGMLAAGIMTDKKELKP